MKDIETCQTKYIENMCIAEVIFSKYFSEIYNRKINNLLSINHVKWMLKYVFVIKCE